MGAGYDHGRGTESIRSPYLLAVNRLSLTRRACRALEESLPISLPEPRTVVVPDDAPRHHVHAGRATRHAKLCSYRRSPSRRGLRWRRRKLLCARSEGRSAATVPLFTAFLFWNRRGDRRYHPPLAALSIHQPALYYYAAATARSLTRTTIRPFCPQALHHRPTGVLFSRKSVSPPTSSLRPPTPVASTPNGKFPLGPALF